VIWDREEEGTELSRVKQRKGMEREEGKRRKEGKRGRRKWMTWPPNKILWCPSADQRNHR
jgi:hypothetical protein